MAKEKPIAFSCLSIILSISYSSLEDSYFYLVTYKTSPKCACMHVHKSLHIVCPHYHLLHYIVLTLHPSQFSTCVLVALVFYAYIRETSLITKIVW